MALGRPAAIGETVFVWLLMAVIAAAFLFGGASRDNAVQVMLVELLALPLLALALWSHRVGGERSLTWGPVAVLAALFLVPLLQLVPLPPEIWTALPGREEAVRTLRLAGLAPAWAPLSLLPDQTYRSVLWLIPPAAVFLATVRLDRRHRFRVAGLVIGLSIASLILGGLQIADRDRGLFQLYVTSHAHLPIGFFSNRNHQGIAMAAALPLAAAFAALWGAASPQHRRSATIVFVGLACLFLVGALATRSRAAVVLALPALIASVSIFWAAAKVRRPRLWVIGGGAVLVVLLLVVARFVLGDLLTRFEGVSAGESRFDTWPAIVKAGASVAPVGSGMGSFEAFFHAYEPLETMTGTFINHAHNDFLELWLESGVAFAATFVGFMLWFARAFLRAWNGPFERDKLLARAGGVVILLLVLHSAADYPMRTQTLACIFAIAAAFLIPSPGKGGSAGGGRTSNRIAP